MFGFPFSKDYYSASLLNLMIREDLTRELEIIRGKDVAVVGAGPSLVDHREFEGEVMISADGATNYLLSLGIVPDVIVTDLDGITQFPDSLYVVHAHGDNYHLLHKVSELKRVVGTTQVPPFGRLKLFGGFTDGDRAVVLARAFGARRIRLYGMDLDSPMVGRYSKPWLSSDSPASRLKRLKLRVAKDIINEVIGKDL